MTDDRKAIFLFGPTAVGKTELLRSLFSSGFEVVNADSIQVYRKLDIGSAKADAQTMAIVPHHLIDIVDPWENFSTGDFVRLADEACAGIRSRGNIPVVCGGTAYYFRNFLYGMSKAPQSNPQTRREVAQWMEGLGNRKAHEFLASVDPVSAARINVNDTYRISRAIEVWRDSGKPLSSFEVPSVPRDGMKVLTIGLCRDKSLLDKRIRMRVDLMFEAGIVDEVRMLVEMGASSAWQSMQGIGYSEFIRALESISDDGRPHSGDIERLDMARIADGITMDSVHYAKRQMTFFRSFPDVFWTEPDSDHMKESIPLIEKFSIQSSPLPAM